MIGSLSGKIEIINSNLVIIDTGGVGYEVNMTENNVADFLDGDNVKVYTYLSVKEDSMTLFGFVSLNELNLFKKLITVNGLGPKGALALINSVGMNDVIYAILNGDDKTISKAPGIGKKTAQKVVIELKDKVFKFETFNTPKPVHKITSQDESDAIEALITLGYSKREATGAVTKVYKENMDLDAIISESLSLLSKF